MPSNHLILFRPLLLLPSIFPGIRVFSNELVFHIRRPKDWSFSFSISPSNEYSGLISFRIDWFEILAVQGTLKNILQHQSSTLTGGWAVSKWGKRLKKGLCLSKSTLWDRRKTVLELRAQKRPFLASRYKGTIVGLKDRGIHMRVWGQWRAGWARNYACPLWSLTHFWLCDPTPTPRPKCFKGEELGGESLDWHVVDSMGTRSVRDLSSRSLQPVGAGWCTTMGDGCQWDESKSSWKPETHPVTHSSASGVCCWGLCYLSLGSLLNLGTKCSEVSVCISQGLDFKTPGLGSSGNWTLNHLDLCPQWCWVFLFWGIDSRLRPTSSRLGWGLDVESTRVRPRHTRVPVSLVPSPRLACVCL